MGGSGVAAYGAGAEVKNGNGPRAEREGENMFGQREDSMISRRSEVDSGEWWKKKERG